MQIGVWQLAQVRSLAAVNTPSDTFRAAGGTLGGDEKQREAVREKLRVMKGVHSQFSHVDDAAVEMKVA
eukprot:11179445-Lingulodinium_polyedra.AAC.1